MSFVAACRRWGAWEPRAGFDPVAPLRQLDANRSPAKPRSPHEQRRGAL